MMGLVEDILDGVKDLAEGSRLAREGEYAVGSAFFKPEDFEGVWDRLMVVVEGYAKGGEVIETTISGGTVTDSGIPGFKIKRGRFAEVYGYQETEAVFIRLYHLVSETKEWLALYMDSNKKTPWWSKAERSGL